jgi:RimJ/RimL family protein N-acetyltransferase
VELRAATTDDLDSALDLLEAVASERRWIGAEPPVDRAATRAKWVEGFIRVRSGAMFVALDDGRVVGVAQMKGDGLSELGMYVDASMRRRGMGSALLEACIRWAGEAGAYKIRLQVWPHNTSAIALYEKFGFEREGYLRRHYRRRSGEIWDCVLMGLVLD